MESLHLRGDRERWKYIGNVTGSSFLFFLPERVGDYMTGTTRNLAKKFVSEDDEWYVDIYEANTVVGMDDSSNFGGFLAALHDRDIDHRVVESGEEGWFTVEVYR